MTEQEDYQRLLNQLESPQTHHPEDQDLQETLGKEVLKDQESYLRLALVDGVGCRTMRRLLSRFGSAKDVLRASLRDLGSVERVGPKTATAIRDIGQGAYADEVLKICKQQNIELLFPDRKSVV